MPNIKSAKKRAEKSEKLRQANKARKSSLRTAIKKVTNSLATNAEGVRGDLTSAIKHLDKAAAAGIIHKNAAARKKSRLTKKLNALSQ